MAICDQSLHWSEVIEMPPQFQWCRQHEITYRRDVCRSQCFWSQKKTNPAYHILLSCIALRIDADMDRAGVRSRNHHIKGYWYSLVPKQPTPSIQQVILFLTSPRRSSVELQWIEPTYCILMAIPNLATGGNDPSSSGPCGFWIKLWPCCGGVFFRDDSSSWFFVAL